MKKSELKRLIREIVQETVPDFDATKGIGSHIQIETAIHDLAYDVRKLRAAKDAGAEYEVLRTLSDDVEKLSIYLKKTLERRQKTFPTNPTE